MHKFFLDRKKQFESKEGRMGLLIELTTTQAEFNRSRVLVNAMRISVCRTLGFSEDGKES